VGDDPMMITYHDTEWGVPSRDDHHLFEMMVLESAQSGLSWRTILTKRDGYRRLFAGFDPVVVASFDGDDVDRLVLDPGIVRHRRKIESAINNARRFVAVAGKAGGFAPYLWSFTNDKVVRNHWGELAQVPAVSPLSITIAADLKRRGFAFLGPTTVYSFLQAVGVVDDHLITCPRW